MDSAFLNSLTGTDELLNQSMLFVGGLALNKLLLLSMLLLASQWAFPFPSLLLCPSITLQPCSFFLIIPILLGFSTKFHQHFSVSLTICFCNHPILLLQVSLYLCSQFFFFPTTTLPPYSPFITPAYDLNANPSLCIPALYPLLQYSSWIFCSVKEMLEA